MNQANNISSMIRNLNSKSCIHDSIISVNSCVKYDLTQNMLSNSVFTPYYDNINIFFSCQLPCSSHIHILLCTTSCTVALNA